jgi:hypothetical protein
LYSDQASIQTVASAASVPPAGTDFCKEEFMSVSLPPDRIRAICKQRWQWYVLCSFVSFGAFASLFNERLAGHHTGLSPIRLGTLGLALALMALGDWIWRCPACKGRLPRGLEPLPQYCPRCAVPLSDPSEPLLIGSPAAKQVAYGCIGFLVLMSLAMPVILPHRRHPVPGGRAATVIALPTPADQEERRSRITTVDQLLAARRPGARLQGTKADLDLLQRLLDSGQLKPAQTYELQCVGMAFGTVLANETGLHWVIVEDAYGRDPALQYENSSLILFPLTMISKRVEEGERVDLRRLFQALQAAVKRRGPEADRASKLV